MGTDNDSPNLICSPPFCRPCLADQLRSGLTEPALPQVRERVINVSSISSSSQMDWGNLEGEQRYSAEAQYETSKARDPDSQQC